MLPKLLINSTVPDKELLVALIKEQHVREWVTTVVAIPAVITIVWAHYIHVSTINLVGWAGYMALTLVLRTVVGERHIRLPTVSRHLKREFYIQALVSALYGIGWGGLVYALDTDALDFLLILKVATVTATLGVVLNSMSVIFPIYLAFLVPVVGLLSFHIFFVGTFFQPSEKIAAFAGVLMYGGVLVLSALNISKLTKLAFEQGFERDRALAEARESHERELAMSKQLASMARQDALTGVYNRRHLDEALQNCVLTSHRHQVEFSVILIDVDHFKQINDTFGHQVGDLVLIGLSKFVTQALREIDVFGRWGGEEFLCILPHTQFESAMLCAERLREGLAAMLFVPAHPELLVTASFGLVTCHADEGGEDIMKRVDAALYAAKSAGRNRVVGSED